MSVDWQFHAWLDALYNGKKQGQTSVTPYTINKKLRYVVIGIEDTSNDLTVISVSPDAAEEFGMRIIAAARQARGEFV